MDFIIFGDNMPFHNFLMFSKKVTTLHCYRGGGGGGNGLSAPAMYKHTHIQL